MWVRKARKALVGWTCYVVGWFLAMLFIDLISEGPERITSAYLIARPAVLGVFWLGGVLVIRWWARGAVGEPDRTDDAGS
ncbi:hypothetical protein [Nonomuraea angiospora]